MKPFLLPFAFLLATAARAADPPDVHWGDQGDGTFRNPVLAMDYSDPDVARKGGDFYMVASTFEGVPGVPVLHSRDLVNWESVGAVFNDLAAFGPDFNWDRMRRYGGGIYAPSIRFHDGRFWVFVNAYSGEGFFCCTAVDPAGPWTVTQIKDRHGRPLRTHGWTDPCPFWDDDGKAYLASSRPGGHWFGYLFEMTPDGTRLLDADVDKMNAGDGPYAYPDGGTLIAPFQSTEGNKIYKRNGYYYLIHIEFTDKGQGAGTYVMRSRHLYGEKVGGAPGKPGDPGKYESYRFSTAKGGVQDLPGQGGLIDTPDGRWFYMAQFNRYGSDGRTPNLLPVTWINDWPVPGIDLQARQGKFAPRLPKPIAGQPIAMPQGSDEFDRPALDPRWEWNHQPRADHWSLTERPGFLRLHAFRPAGGGGFFQAGNTILQRFAPSEMTQVVVRLEIGGMADGQEAGLAHFNSGKNHALLAVVQKSGAKTLQYEEDETVAPGSALPAGATAVWLRSRVGPDGVNAFSYSLDGTSFSDLPGSYKPRAGNYRGGMVGIYTYSHEAEAGFIDVDYFHYDFKNR